MQERLEALEAQVATLLRELETLDRRVGSLEAGAAATVPGARRRRRGAGGEGAAPADAPPVAAGAAASVEAIAPLVGRTLLVLAGAFVLRALTDAGTLPTMVGVALGFVYAGGVLALAARAARPVSAGFHGLTAVLIGFPLILEATVRFRLLGPALSALLLAAMGSSMIAMAAWRRLHWVAWLGAAGVVVTGLALVLATERLAPVALALVAVGTLTLWLGYLLDWHALRWPVAAAADLLVALVALRAVAPTAAEGPVLAQVTAALLLVAYLGSFAARTLSLGRPMVAFEVAQTAGVLVAGLGGAAYVAARSTAGATSLGLVTLALAAGAYAVAFAFVERRQKASSNFPFYATVALAFVLAGTWLALPGVARGVTLAVMALTATTLARVRAPRTLVAHAAALSVSAAASAGLASHANLALFGSAAVAWPPLPALALVALAGLAAAAVPSGRTGVRTGLVERLPQLVLVTVVAFSAAGVLAGWVAGLLGPPGPDAELALIGTGRTAVLAICAILVAWLGRREAWREAGWLAWPILAVLGLKLLLEDLPRGRPATLVLSFAFTGAALILVPRLRARPLAP